MKKIWLDHYPSSVPKTIAPPLWPSLSAMFMHSATRYAERPAITQLDVTLTYTELASAANAFACSLQALGLRQGDRIALMMPNILAYPVALFGAWHAGLIVVNVNPIYTPRELLHQLKDADVRAIVVADVCAHTLATIREQVPGLQHTVVAQIGDCFPWPKRSIVQFVIAHVQQKLAPYFLPGHLRFAKLLHQYAGQQPETLAQDPDHIAVLQYTGGTTGISKGAMLTHRQLLSNVAQCAAWLLPFADPDGDLVLTPLPMYHIFSLTTNLLLFSGVGGHLVLVTNPRDISGLVKTMKKYPFTIMTGVNTLFNALLNHPDFTNADFSRLRICIAGGMAAQAQVAARWRKVTGCMLTEGYGLTECSPVVATNPLDQTAFSGAVGMPLPSTDINIRASDGTSLGVGEIGEVWVSGPQLMAGYWRRSDETANVMDARGFLDTGDIGEIRKDGYLRIVDRKKDLILVSGFNVYPNEVEDVLATHPLVQEVAVIGLPDPDCGEAVIACVVVQDKSMTAQELIHYARSELTPYKVPKTVYFYEELPKTNVGKILRRALRDELLAQLPNRVG